jgi:hypothetical protein
MSGKNDGVEIPMQDTYAKVILNQAFLNQPTTSSHYLQTLSPFPISSPISCHQYKTPSHPIIFSPYTWKHKPWTRKDGAPSNRSSSDRSSLDHVKLSSKRIAQTVPAYYLLYGANDCPTNPPIRLETYHQPYSSHRYLILMNK